MAHIDDFMSPSTNIIAELDHQLELWRLHLPVALSFPAISISQAQEISRATGPRTIREKLVGVLQARYCAAKTTMHRPFIYRCLHCDDIASLSDDDLGKAQLALFAALFIPLHSGLLSENLSLLPHPMNPCRRYWTPYMYRSHEILTATSFFAAAILATLLHHRFSRTHVGLFDDSGIVYLVQTRIAASAGQHSPIIKRDLELLDKLEPN